MSTLIDVALALVVGWNGTNGLDPALLHGTVDDRGIFVIDSPEFLKWIEEDPRERAMTAKYLVRCALDDKKVIKAGRYGTWSGELGLAPSALTQPSSASRRWTFQLGGRGKADWGGNLDDERLWVSACLMAFVNTGRLHEYVSIRGNPPYPAFPAQSKVVPTAAERWTEGYPEGVFFADLFAGKPAIGEDLRSYTVSMNLPAGYAEQTAGWRPPNAALGRTLDYAAETTVQVDDSRPLIARKLGAYHQHASSFANPTNPRDPVYKADAVCVKDQDSPRTATLVACDSSEYRTLRPLFVHLPRLANLESPELEEDLKKALQVLDRGSVRITPKQVRDCTGQACIGAFLPLASAATPEDPTPLGHGKRLVGLSVGQVLEPTLRFLTGLETPPLERPAAQSYTAIIRYMSPKPSRALVRIQVEKDTYRDAGHTWPSTISCDGNYQWLQVYPVYPDKDMVLRIRILGEKGSAPELDAVGFVPGKPWCAPSADRPFMGVCH